MSREPDAVETDGDVEQVIGKIDARGNAIRARELDRALSQLQANGELTPTQRSVVEQLSEQLVDRLLSVPRTTLREAAARGDEAAVETALSLFE